ncbi:MAG: hypothetical protein WKF42_02135 [Solirubrobacteraceae bacterium]
MAGVVVAVAVELDRQPSVRPAAVDSPSADQPVGQRQLEVGGTQQRAAAARPHGSQVERFDAWGALSAAVHAALLGQQRAAPQALLDLANGDAGTQQLLSRHHAMPRTRETSESLSTVLP